LEELHACQWMAAALGATAILASELVPQGKADGFLIQAERSANARGGRLLGLAESGARAALDQARAGKTRLLVVSTGDLELGGAPAMALLSTHACAAETGARVVLPLAVWAEQDGVFVNRLGLAQRARRAVEPLEAALPAWDWALRLAQAMGLKAPYPAQAEAIFDAISAESVAFAGLSYAALGSQGAPVREGK
jgi:NADH dehydrogenase/NADH:ubiquinone oxidoreductase subunit G